nr:ribonuclease H-like domain-containing protein [Tanacetum cinerariifolium]
KVVIGSCVSTFTLEMQVALHNEITVMQFTLHNDIIVMQVTLPIEIIVMQVTLHNDIIVMQVTLHNEIIVMQVTLHYEFKAKISPRNSVPSKNAYSRREEGDSETSLHSTISHGKEYLPSFRIEDIMKSSPICLLSKASKTKSWLWHRRLNNLNFGTINDLARKDLVRRIPRLKFEKDHIGSACQLGKSKKHTHLPKTENTNLKVLNTLHMDLCGPMRVQTINWKKYILVIVEDYTRFTWVKFLRSKDETLEKQDRALFRFASGVAAILGFQVLSICTYLLEAENASTVPNREYVAKCLYTVTPFIHSLGDGLPGGSMGLGGGRGRSPFRRGFFAGNENADPADMGVAEQHQNIARREWDELCSSQEWILVENHFARCDRKINAIFEKARSMYRDGHLALDIEDESDIKRGLDAYFSNLYEFPSNGHRFQRLKLVAGCLGNARSPIWA